MAVVEIETEEAITGSGWCEDGCSAISLIIENHLSRLLIGQDAGEIEGLWDRLFRATLPYGRKGVALHALSAIDLALWDLAGKAAGKPVYELLGGPVKPDIQVYASALHPVGHEKVQRSDDRPVGAECRAPGGADHGNKNKHIHLSFIPCSLPRPNTGGVKMVGRSSAYWLSSTSK